MRLVLLSLGGSGNDHSRCMHIVDLMAVYPRVFNFISIQIYFFGGKGTYQDIFTACFGAVFDVEPD